MSFLTIVYAMIAGFLVAIICDYFLIKLKYMIFLSALAGGLVGYYL